MNEELSDLRNKIDYIDSQITDLLVKRFDMSLQIGALKQRLKLPVRDERREQELLANIVRNGKGKLDDGFVVRLFGAVMEESRRVQQENLPA